MKEKGTHQSNVNVFLFEFNRSVSVIVSVNSTEIGRNSTLAEILSQWLVP